LAGKAVRDPPVLASYTGVSLAVQVEIKLPTWTGLHWTAATLLVVFHDEGSHREIKRPVYVEVVGLERV
jgi:hypothetical protein